MTTGSRMKSRRKELGIPVDCVAEALHVSVATVYRYENGDIEKVPGAVLEPLAKVLHTTPAYLMGWDDNPNSCDSALKQTEQRFSVIAGTGETISAEAKEIAKAFDKATPKEQNLVRLTLSEYLDEEGYQIAAARGNSAVKIPIQRGMDDFPENDSIVDDL